MAEFGVIIEKIGLAHSPIMKETWSPIWENQCPAELDLPRFIIFISLDEFSILLFKVIHNFISYQNNYPTEAPIQFEGSGRSIKCEIVMKAIHRISQGYAYCLGEKLNSPGLHYNQFIINTLRVERLSKLSGQINTSGCMYLLIIKTLYISIHRIQPCSMSED